MTADHWDAQADTEAAAWHAVFSEPGVGDHTVEDVRRIVDQLGDLQLLPLVEIGCGVSRLTGRVQSATNREVCGWDISPKMIGWSRARNVNPFISYHAGSWPEMAVHDRFYGGGWSMLTFQHMPEWDVHGYLAILSHRLVNRARFVVQFVEPIVDPWQEHHSLADHRYSARFMTQTADAYGFTVVDVDMDSRHPEWLWMTMEVER